MKILHIALASHFTESMLYQENVLVNMNADDGHEVTIISDVWHYEAGKLVRGKAEDKKLPNGVRLIRLEYDKLINEKVAEKIQKCSGLKAWLEKIAPDSILYHGANGYEIMTTAAYCKVHPKCLFYVDDHADFTTTAMTFASRMFYKTVHGVFIHKALPEIDKILYLGIQMKHWLKEIYNIPDEKMEFYAIGGIIYDEEKQASARQDIINKFALPQDAVICAHSGKLSPQKLTKELLTAFSKVQDNRLEMFVFGSIPADQESVIRPLIDADSRIHFMGWKVNKEIEQFLAGVDLYCQPGSQSSTFETAMCCGCANMTYPHETYCDATYSDCQGKNYYYVDGEDDMVEVFKKVVNNPQELAEKKHLTFEYAKKQFDYVEIARRICRKS